MIKTRSKRLKLRVAQSFALDTIAPQSDRETLTQCIQLLVILRSVRLQRLTVLLFDQCTFVLQLLNPLMAGLSVLFASLQKPSSTLWSSSSSSMSSRMSYTRLFLAHRYALQDCKIIVNVDVVVVVVIVIILNFLSSPRRSCVQTSLNRRSASQDCRNH